MTGREAIESNEMDITVEEFDKLFMAYQSVSHKIDKLALFIMENIEGEPSQNEGAIDTAIRLLEKQVAKKPIPLVSVGEDVDLCSVCESRIEEDWNGCPYCLNKIDWSEEE